MTDLTEERINIQSEETAFNAGVSEGTASRIGKSINFINGRQFDTHRWQLNGPYYLLNNTLGPDGIFQFLFDVEVVGFGYHNGLTGSAGTTTVDVHFLDTGGTDQGTIFSTKPSVDTTAANGSYTLFRQTDSTTLANPTGHTLAILSTTQFDAGDALRLDIDSSMTGGENFMFGLMYRPR